MLAVTATRPSIGLHDRYQHAGAAALPAIGNGASAFGQRRSA
jgi:hypothetical protein